MIWIPWAEKLLGPANKQYQEANNIQGFVCHSVEGNLSSVLATLANPNRQASWHFTNAKNGTLYQHYPLTASCWASGSKEANTRYVAMESEGFAGEPLNDAQVANAVKLWMELGFTERQVNLWEHNEVATKWSPNAGPTACPSHRYDNAYIALEEGQVMTPEEVEAIVRKVFDEAYAPYYRTFTDAYWLSKYTDAKGAAIPPDEAVVKAVAEFVINYTDEVINND